MRSLSLPAWNGMVLVSVIALEINPEEQYSLAAFLGKVNDAGLCPSLKASQSTLAVAAAFRRLYDVLGQNRSPRVAIAE